MNFWDVVKQPLLYKGKEKRNKYSGLSFLRGAYATIAILVSPSGLLMYLNLLNLLNLLNPLNLLNLFS